MDTSLPHRQGVTMQASIAAGEAKWSKSGNFSNSTIESLPRNDRNEGITIQTCASRDEKMICKASLSNLRKFGDFASRSLLSLL